MDYLDFELAIEAGTGSTYPVAVIRSPAGEVHATMHFPFDEQALANQLSTVQQALNNLDAMSPQILSTTKQAVEHFGQTLFQALFTGEIGTLYAVSQNAANSQGKGLRLKLHLHPAELAALPWELLYDPGRGKYLCLSNYTPVVRYLELPAPSQPLKATLPLCILGLIASPKDLAPLDVEREKQHIETALADLSAKGLVQLTWLEGRTWKDLQQAMRSGLWHVFHFIGHGVFHPDTNDGMIVLEDEAGQAHYLSATQLGMLLTDHRWLRLVVLNSCEGARGSTHDSFSSTAATLVRQGIPAVLANQYPISDVAAIELSSTFYTALAEGRSVDMAVSEARKAVALGGPQTVEWAVPALHMHTPDGVLFHLPQVAFPSSHTSGSTASATAAPSSASLFVSYARRDLDVVTRLYEDMQRFGVTLWIDHKDILPGSPDWENVIRTALRSAAGVLLVVTPHILNSPYVKDELDIAKLYQRPVYPLWVDGTAWIDCVPLGWGRVQYLDARAERYELALAQLVQLVQKQVSEPPLPSQQTKQEQPSDLPSQSESPKQESPAAPRNPYKGLHYFTTADAEDFFGREQLIADLVDGVTKALGKEQAGSEASRLVAVVGPSGSGKSSVVMAGLLPQLQQNALSGSQQWIYLERMVPGTHPLEELARTLAYQFPARSHASLLEDLTASSTRGLYLLTQQLAQPKQTRVVLLIDQFEELFTQTTDVAEREQFLHVLTAAATELAGSLLIILTLRADFYDRPMQYPALQRLLLVHQVAVVAMESQDLRKVIEQPAALSDVQLSFEEDLVGDLLFELRGQVGALPLLEFTLDQLFQRRSERRLTRQAYQEIGGVKGALAKHAESTYAELPSEEHRRLARVLFLRLLEPGASEQETTRRRAALSEFSFDDQGQTRLMLETRELFVRARLLTTTTNESARTNTIEVSHEALIREWPRLVGWLHEAREDIRLQQSISEDAAEWEKRNKPGERLYRGSQLSEAQAWAARNVASIDEKAFLLASVVESERQEMERSTQQARELDLQRQVAKRQRYVISMIGVTSGVIIIALVVAVFLQAQILASLPGSVTNLNDHGPGSLRQAIAEASDGGSITFARNVQGTILLTTGEIIITKNLAISGPSAFILSVSGGNKSRVFEVSKGVIVTVYNLTIKNGYAKDSGGSILNEGTLLLTNSIITDSTSGAGGGIANEGTLTLANSMVSRNRASDKVDTSAGAGQGGGIANRGVLTLTNSTVFNNTVEGYAGGGISSTSGSFGTSSLTLINSTISDNKVVISPFGGRGGGIFLKDTRASITFCTIYGNVAKGDNGGGISDDGNDLGDHIPIEMVGSIVASNHADFAPDADAEITNDRYNLIGDTSGTTFTDNLLDPRHFIKQNPTDIRISRSTDLKIDPLLHGILPAIHALLPGSPAIDSIPSNIPYIIVCPSTDQRGIKRPDDGEDKCDIGAYEYVDAPT